MAVKEEEARLVEQHSLLEGRAIQGLALADQEYYSANADNICRFDPQWNLLERKKILEDPRLKGRVDHLGAIDVHDGVIWWALLNSKGGTRGVVLDDVGSGCTSGGRRFCRRDILRVRIPLA